jgi:hypothetical protein
MPQSEGLADQISMQGNTHHQRLARRLLQHLVKVIDDHVSEFFGPHAARSNSGNVI